MTIAYIQVYDPRLDQFVNIARVVEGGTGDVEIAQLADIVRLRIHYVNQCPACNGAGKDMLGKQCLRCDGTGYAQA